MAHTARKGSAVVTLPSDTTILIRRDFDAPTHLVYRAWTEPELIKRWWHAKRGVATVADVDLRIGGAWRWVMVTHDGMEVAFHGEYLEIVPDARLVTTEIYEAFPEAQAVNTLTLTDIDGGSRLEILVEHRTKEHRDGHIDSGMEDGLQDALDLVEELVGSL